jgi:thiol:disulfide interchange protein
VKTLVEQNGIVPMLADWTDESAEIKQVLAQYGSNSIPFLVILPAGAHDQPIIMRDVITQEQLLTALQQAGPSQGLEDGADGETEGSTAMLSNERTE